MILNRKSWDIPPIFELIQREGGIARREMSRVFNLGLGLILIVSPRRATAVVSHLRDAGEDARVVGEVVSGSRRVRLR